MARKWRIFFNQLGSFLNRINRRRTVSTRLHIPIANSVPFLFLAMLLLVLATPSLAKDAKPPQPLEQPAQQLYDAGRYREAVSALEQSLQTTSDRVQRATVLSNLSLSYQKLGEWDLAERSVESALQSLQNSQQSAEQTVRAQALDVRASLEMARGHAEQAAEIWQQAAALYDPLGNVDRSTLSRIHQAQALQRLGLNRSAIAILDSLQKTMSQQPDSLTKAAVLRIWGDTLRIATQFTPSEDVTRESLKIAQRLQSPEAIAAAYLSLGNVALAQGTLKQDEGDRKAARIQFKAALDAYQKAADSASVLLRAQANLNALNLLLDTPKTLLPGIDQWAEAKQLSDQLLASIDQLPPGRSSVAIRVGLGRSAIRWQQRHPVDAPNRATTAQLLATAVQQAKALNDPRAIANATGYLGRLYEQAQQWSDAQTLSEQALAQAQSIDAGDLTYRWQWQLGRILRAQEQDSAAISTYTEAFNTLQSLRRDLVSVNTDVQFSFRESVEPVYRQLVDLLLKADTQTSLRQAREVLKALQSAELQNFLQSACHESTLQVDRIVDENDPTAAVIYPIILDDRLEVILKLPKQPELYHAPPVRLSSQEIAAEIKAFQKSLQEPYRFKESREEGQQFYSWLIQPLQEQLNKSQIKTLVFVLDGSLRNIPMAALYDGNQYLAERYAVSLVLGMDVREPVPMNRSALRVLAASLTDAPSDFPQYDQLKYANQELDKIQQSGVQTKLIRDRAFTKNQFNHELNSSSFQVIHLATHGQFGADRNNTYILAADGAIHIDELDQLFRSQRQKQANLDLLILSACKTAAGNDRAVLGIAGTAVKAGAQSVIAGLWSLADEPSVLFTKTLYENLGKPNVSRAEALRRAQVALLNTEEFSHPRYWAPYVLVGSWL